MVTRGTTKPIALLAALLAGCLSPADGQFLCEAPDFACPDGMTCSADGVCRGSAEPIDGGVDAGPRDASPDAPPEDAAVDAGPGDAGVPDAGPTCAARGLTDDDGDGFCAGRDEVDTDCDDADEEVHPGAPEVCAASGAARDEDCDEGVDEGCGFTVGLVHAPIKVHVPGAAHFGAALSTDGMRLYFVPSGTGSSAVFVAARAALDQPFGVPTEVPGTAQDLATTTATLTGDELEVVVEASRTAGSTRLYAAARGATSEPFGALLEVTEARGASGAQRYPSISRDGTELYYEHVEVGASELRRLVRDDASGVEGWSAPETVVALGNPSHPRLSADGLTLRFTLEGEGLAFLVRASPSDPFAGTPTLDRRFGPQAMLAYEDPATKEIWFTMHAPDLASIDPRAPMLTSIFRAQACYGGPCAAAPTVTCDAPAVRTPDGLHCFSVTADAGAGWGFVRDRCVDIGGRLASLHTGEEVATVAPLVGTSRYLGIQRASSSAEWVWQPLDGVREPFLWPEGTDPRWQAGQPMGTNTFAVVDTTGWAPFTGSGAGVLGLCERELWPTW